MRRLQRGLVGPDAFAIRLKPRQFAGARPGGDDDIGRAQILGTLVGLDFDLALGGNGGRAHHDRNLVLFHQVADARG